MISPELRAAYELQATACLEAAEKYRAPLLALAVNLGGSHEAGMELYQQALLSCHDAIQTGGFEGDGYTFYLRRAIRNGYYAGQKRARRHTSLAAHEPTPAEELPEGWEPDTTERQHRAEWLATNVPTPEYTHLAERVMAEAQVRFEPADRVALRLHLWGMSCQQIAEAIGMKDQSWVWRRLDRMKATLRNLFQGDFDALGE